MKILFEQKKPGRLKQTIKPMVVDIDLKNHTVDGLITSTVKRFVEIYNDSFSQTPEEFDNDTQHAVISSRDISDLAEAGRVAFGIVFGGKPVVEEEAIINALQCYEDGLFRIFLNGTQLGRGKEYIDIKEGDTVTIVRLTMLAGRMW